MGKIRVGRAIKSVALELLATVKCGDTVLVCDGVAITKVEAASGERSENVSGDSGKID